MYQANPVRYDSMQYRRCGNSGLKLPAVSLGLWHNFGDTASYSSMKEICFTAFNSISVCRLQPADAVLLLHCQAIQADGRLSVPLISENHP